MASLSKMIRLSVLYPTTEGADFDFAYYVDTHIPLALRTWNLSSAEIDRGIDGPYLCAAHFLFGSLAELGEAVSAEGNDELNADVANLTTITPIAQISEIL